MKKSILFVVALVVVMASFVACNKAEAVETPVASETVSSEEVSVEISEEVSEEVSEEPSEKEIDLTQYSRANGKNVVDLANDMNYDEIKMIVWADIRAKKILSNGDSYYTYPTETLWLYYPQKMTEVKCNLLHNEGSIAQIDGETFDNLDAFHFLTSKENVEVTINATGEDGTTYEFTVYLTEDQFSPK